MSFRRVQDITASEFLGALTAERQTQHEIFVKLGGDPLDRNYARLSFLTRELRRKGHVILTSRAGGGVWLPSKNEAQAA